MLPESFGRGYGGGPGGRGGGGGLRTGGDRGPPPPRWERDRSRSRSPPFRRVVVTHGMAVARLRGVATGNIVEMIGGGAIAAALPRRGGAGAPAPHGVAAARCRHGGADHQMWSL
jgi:hypothetical protein